MDTRQIEYMLKIAEENNITHAANKLFITQSALNQQLLKLEKELGTPLFHRSRSNWHLTQAGEIYVQNAKEILRIKRNAYQMIHDLSDGTRGQLSVGFTSGRGIKMFTSAYALFQNLYPNVVVEPVEDVVINLQRRISTGDLDLCFLTLTDKDRTDDAYEIIFHEELFLVIPSIHPLAKIRPAAGETYATLDISRVKHEPFVLMGKHSTMRTMVDDIFGQAGFSPNILFETGNNHTILAMIEANLCCGILPYYYIQQAPACMTSFRLPARPTWQFAASYKKGHYLSDPARCFIDVMKQQWGRQTTAST